jgi:predicted dehydrogenase
MTVGNNNVLRIGVAGAGRMGAILIENLLSLRYVEVTAICTVIDKEKKWVSKTVPAASIYDTFDEFIEDRNVETQCSPSFFHKNQFRKAHKHYLREAPFP